MNRICKIKGCDGSQRRNIKGYCLMHYTRLRTKGELGPSVKIENSHGACIVEKCDTRAGPTGACRNHWHKVNNPTKSRKRTLRYFGITEERYVAMLAEQGEKCKVCGTVNPGLGLKNFHIDHDHACCPTFKTCGLCIRGLLCSRCNVALGQVNDSIPLLQAMIKYLKNAKLLDHPDYNTA